MIQTLGIRCKSCKRSADRLLLREVIKTDRFWSLTSVSAETDQSSSLTMADADKYAPMDLKKAVVLITGK